MVLRVYDDVYSILLLPCNHTPCHISCKSLLRSPCGVDYAFKLAPGQTPYRDQYFIEKLVGLGENDGIKVRTTTSQFCKFGLIGALSAAIAHDL